MIEKVLNSRAWSIFVAIQTKIRRAKNKAKLRNSKITILSSNCTGGIIYHELGLSFLSPTINIRIPSNDFVRFILNAEEYLKKELVFFQSDEDCPAAYLGDIPIYFVHYKTEEESRNKWEERKKRINWGNVYVILNDRDGVTHEDILALQKANYRNMVVFTSKQYEDCPNSFYMSQFAGQPEVGYTLGHIPRTGEWYFEHYFDYVAWLNSDHENCEKFRKK